MSRSHGQVQFLWLKFASLLRPRGRSAAAGVEEDTAMISQSVHDTSETEQSAAAITLIRLQHAINSTARKGHRSDHHHARHAAYGPRLLPDAASTKAALTSQCPSRAFASKTLPNVCAYHATAAIRSPTCRISQGDRFSNLGRAVPETWENPNISPVMCAYSCT